MTMSRGTDARHTERGSASVLLVACCVAVLLVGLMAATLAGAGRAGAQARVAADLSALAAATTIVQGLRGPPGADPCEAAAQVARRNAAALSSCTVDGHVNVTVQVTVALSGPQSRLPGVGEAKAAARAGPATDPEGPDEETLDGTRPRSIASEGP